jgi:peptidoglycan-N-acetylmuramic acid deacetylase
VTQDIGYTTIFWSMAFYDYDTANQPGKAAIYNQFMAHYHKGEIVLLHAISKSDTQALPSIIKAMKKKGYSFGMLSELKKS